MHRKCWGFGPASVRAFCKQCLCLLVITGFLTGCASTGTLVYRNPNFDQSKSYRVAVFPFHDAPQSPGSGNALSTIFESTLLASGGKFEVVERGEIERILRERHPDVNGMGASVGRDSGQEFEDPVAVGKLLRVDLVIVGTVTNWTQGVQAGWATFSTTAVGASVKAVSVEKGVIVWSLDQSAQPAWVLTGPVDAVARKLCRQMVATFVGE